MCKFIIFICPHSHKYSHHTEMLTYTHMSAKAEVKPTPLRMICLLQAGKRKEKVPYFYGLPNFPGLCLKIVSWSRLSFESPVY